MIDHILDLRNKKNKILITGDGYGIGKSIVSRSLDRHHKVAILDMQEGVFPEDVLFEQGDLTHHETAINLKINIAHFYPVSGNLKNCSVVFVNSVAVRHSYPYGGPGCGY